MLGVMEDSGYEEAFVSLAFCTLKILLNVKRLICVEVSFSPLIVETRKNLKLKAWNETIRRGFFTGAWRDDKEIIQSFQNVKTPS